MEIPSNSKELFDFLVKEHKRIADLRDELNHDIAGKKISSIRERRSFLQNIAVASATLLGLASVFSSLHGSTVLFPYLIPGLILHLGVICVVFVYIRDSLDQDLEGLTSIQDDYGELLRENMNLADKLLSPALETKNENDVQKIMAQYLEGVNNLPSINKLKQDNKELDEERESRRAGRAELDFFGELITFLFVLGVLFVIVAIFGKPLHWLLIIAGITVTFLFTFTNFLNCTLKRFFKVLTYLRHRHFI